MCCTTLDPNADDAEGQALLAKFKGRKLPMVDRVEISIIEEVQPRWLSFLNKQSDVAWLVPFDFVNTAAPNGKLAPFLAKQDVQDVSDACLGHHAVLLQHGGPGGRRIYARQGGTAPRDRTCDRHRPGDSFVLARPGGAGAFGPDAQHRRLRQGLCRAEPIDLAQARALLDTYGYVDRDGDGWREQPDGSPLVLQWATTPDQRARQRDELRRKDMNAHRHSR